MSTVRNAALEAISELEDLHRPMWSSEASVRAGKEPIGCILCFPGDGRWPCDSRQVATDLRAALDLT